MNVVKTTGNVNLAIENSFFNEFFYFLFKEILYFIFLIIYDTIILTGVIMEKQRINLYNKAEKTWGLVAQYDQAIEEMGELIVAINKYKRKCLYGELKNNEKAELNLIEELADVFMCVEQLILYMGEGKVFAMLDNKLEKLKHEIQYMESKS